MKKTFFTQGFTLIEVMVVVVIIGILATAGFGSFNQARVDAKNKSFATELKEVQLAIELYRAQKGEYPPANTVCDSPVFGATVADSSSCGASSVIGELVPNFIAEMPDIDDSGNSNCELEYIVESPNQTWYKLTASECFGGAGSAAEGVQVGDPLARCASTCPVSGNCLQTNASFYTSFAIYSDGGQCR